MKLELVTTEYKTIPGIFQLVYEKRIEFIKMLGKEPKGIILGPNEYISVIEAINKDHRYGGAILGYPDELMGMKISLKQSSGIECEIEKSDAFFFAKGNIK